MTTVPLIIRFSRAASPTLAERWRDKTPWNVSICICRLTHSPFSHVDILLDDGNLLGASDNEYAPVVSGNPRGVAIRPPHYQRFAVRRDAVMQTSPAVKKAFLNFAHDQVGKPFDGSALSVKQFLSPQFSDRDWRKDDRWFCAEMVGRCTEVSCLLPWKYPGIKGRLTPADYLNWAASLIDFNYFLSPIPGLKLDPGEM